MKNEREVEEKEKLRMREQERKKRSRKAQEEKEIWEGLERIRKEEVDKRVNDRAWIEDEEQNRRICREEERKKEREREEEDRKFRKNRFWWREDIRKRNEAREENGGEAFCKGKSCRERVKPIFCSGCEGKLGKGGYCEGGQGERPVEATGKRKREDEEEGQGLQDDEWREFGDKCMNCFGYHKKGYWCQGAASKCDYLGCMDRRRKHASRACFALMKRCCHAACSNQRGHIEKAHKNLWCLGEEDHAYELRKAFEEKEDWLTVWEKEKIKAYEKEMDNLMRVTKKMRLEDPKEKTN